MARNALRSSVLALALLASVVAVLGAAGIARAQGGSDEQSLRVAHETLLSSVTTGNLTLVQGMIQPGAMGFFRDSQFLVQISGDVRIADVLSSLVTDLGRFVSTPTKTVYRAFGPVGMVSMTATLQAKKGEKQPDRFMRGTYVYTLEGGNWKLVSWHASDTPLKKK